jgi:hypothetical protein
MSQSVWCFSFILSVLSVQVWEMIELSIELCNCLQIIIFVSQLENLQSLFIVYCFFSNRDGSAEVAVLVSSSFLFSHHTPHSHPR